MLETDRLILKNGTIDDWVKVHEYDFNYLMNIDGIFEYVKRTPEEVRGWFGNPNSKDIIKLNNNKNNYDFIIYIKETMEPIGYISFDRNNRELKSTEIACYIHPNYWGNGFMYETIINNK